MDQENIDEDAEVHYPILFIPKMCTTLETNSDMSDNVYIDLKVTSPDTEGNETCIYSGLCNVKIVNSYNINITCVESPISQDYSGSPVDNSDIEQMPIIFSEANQMSFPLYNQSQVWMDPSRSPYVYNHYDPSSQETYAIHDSGGHITVEQHNTYITQNVYNCSESDVCNNKDLQQSEKDFEHMQFRKMSETVTNQQDPNVNIYGEDEFECGVFLSQLPEEIMNETINRVRKESKSVGRKDESNALKQLMSTDIQSTSKQQKTILFLGHDSKSGQTIQNISYNDPMTKCVGQLEVDNEVIIGNDSLSPKPKKKKYQCDKCKQIFDQISSFRLHMIGNHYKVLSQEHEANFTCADCGKNLKTQRKFEIHCLGHGDPDLECLKCNKVYSSKFTLRAHQKIHNRKFSCNYCVRSYSTTEDLRVHLEKIHMMFICKYEDCSFVGGASSELFVHQNNHLNKQPNETDSNDSYMDQTPGPSRENLEQDLIATKEADWNSSDDEVLKGNDAGERIRKADSVIAKVSDKMFLLNSKAKNRGICYRTCEVCYKSFNRASDLKRHLIEHIVRTSLAKTPVTLNGTLNIICEICQIATFTKIDKYKAHLREHARLTLYKCTFCDKSFSDSSNFSKHKKIHGIAYLQCDLCLRKFNTKKMIAQHMEYHKKNKPRKCRYCKRTFYFESMLKKHIKCAHSKEFRYRCQFCEVGFGALKDKWDHEWLVHSVRKIKVDCPLCGCKFRKYSELKKHCTDDHDLNMPVAKKFFKKKMRR